LVMRILGGAAGPGRRLQCPASLANKLVEGCEPVSSKGAWLCGQGGLQSAPGAESAGRSDRAILGISYRFSWSAASVPRPCGVGSGIGFVRLGHHGDSVARVAKQILP
jgi:hypothetical protein